MEKRRPRRRNSYHVLMDSRSEHAHTAMEASRQRQEHVEKLVKAITERGVVVEQLADEAGRPFTRYSLGPEVHDTENDATAIQAELPQQEPEEGGENG